MNRKQLIANQLRMLIIARRHGHFPKSFNVDDLIELAKQFTKETTNETQTQENH